MFVDLCHAIGGSAIAGDERFSTAAGRLENRDALNEALQAPLSDGTSAEWVERLNDAGVPCGPIYSIDQVFADPQVKHLDMTRRVSNATIGEFDIVRNCIDLAGAQDEPYRATPERGEHTDEVLAQFGFDDSAIAALRRDGAI